MTELLFRVSLYSPAAIDRALEAFAPFADFERQMRDGVEVVRLTAKPGEDEPLIAGELANYVLGATVDGADPKTVKET
jgi:hypothetical protein